MTGASSAQAEGVLIAAFSGRALAAAARRAGYAPLVADLFADADTARLAARNVQVEGDLAGGFRAEHLLACLERLAAEGPAPVGLVYGAGFEANPELLAEMGKRWRLLGNAPEVVTRVKEPHTFAATCARLGIPHPEIANIPPVPPESWLSKRTGGAGGAHITVASAAESGGEDVYFQRQVAGRPVSALFVAAGGDARVIGFSEQWRAPTPGEPFRFGGAVRPAELDARLEAALAGAVRLAAREFGLAGLNSADFIAGEAGWWLLEINPRPGATLDIFDMAVQPLFAMHLDAIKNATLPPVSKLDGAAATQIVYASRAISVPSNLRYPGWTVDQPRPGASLEVNEPFCTVLAREVTACEAKAECAKRGRFWQIVLEDRLWIRAW